MEASDFRHRLNHTRTFVYRAGNTVADAGSIPAPASSNYGEVAQW